MPSALCSVFLSAWEEEEKKEEEEEDGDDDDVWSGLGGGAAAAAAAAAGKGEAGEIETWKPQSARDPARQAHGRLPSSFMGKVWKQQMYPQYATYYYPQYLQAKVKGSRGAGDAGGARGSGPGRGARGEPPPPPAELMEGC